MTEALKCPDCAASLEYPPDGATSMRCPYCNSTVLLQGGASAPAGRGTDFASALGPRIGDAVKLAEVINRLKAGDKIGAIRVYRQTFNADLSTAKAAVDKVADHHQIDSGNSQSFAYRSPDPVKVVSSAIKMGLVLTGGILLFTGLIFYFVFSSVHRQLATISRPSSPRIPLVLPKLPQSPILSAAPEFAHKVMEFGSEGIGAGGFEDVRSIATDGQGHIYVGDYSDGRIQAFDADGKFLLMWSIGQGKYLLNLTADRHGVVYAVESDHIYRYEGATGTLLGEVDTSHDDVREYCSDAFSALNGHLYAIGGNSAILDIGADNQMKHVIDTREKVGEEVDFHRIIVLATGEIYAMDSSKGIFKFASDGRYINRFGGGRSRTTGHLLSPRNMAVDGKGRIYVSDGIAAIQVFDDEGSFLGSFGGTAAVFGLAVTDQNEIYACFRNEGSIRKYVVDKN